MPERFDVAPFALPNTPAHELRWEEPRDVHRVEFRFEGEAPVGVSYLQRTWPMHVAQFAPADQNPAGFGWVPIDDQYNTAWRAASCDVDVRGQVAVVEFRPIREEFPDAPDGEIRFRRTLGIRIEGIGTRLLERPIVTTGRQAVESELLIESTPNAASGATVSEVYNAQVLAEDAEGCRRWVRLRHMDLNGAPESDDALVTFAIGDERFTVSLQAIWNLGPVWFEARGFFVKFASDPTRLEDYLAIYSGRECLAQRVKERPEHSYGAAYNGQPRPHGAAVNLGCKHAWQRFLLEPNGDLVLVERNVHRIRGKDWDRFFGEGAVRFFFGLERWRTVSRGQNSGPGPIYTLVARRGDLKVEQRAFAVPIGQSHARVRGDDDIAALVCFRFTNRGPSAELASIELGLSSRSDRSFHPFHGHRQNGDLVPISTRDTLRVHEGRILSRFDGKEVFRGLARTSMDSDGQGGWRQALAPGESCELHLKIPFCVPLEERSLACLGFDPALRDTDAFWRAECAQGAQLTVPEEHLTALHRSHLAHVQITDFSMPDDPRLVNTSVGTSTYGNYTNESCMVVRELDERGLTDEARRRIEVWLRYQGTAPQPGNFTDNDGMFFGAGGFEDGAYNQHHGWALWRICEHYLFTRDDAWFCGIADAIVQGAEWVFRQRRGTMGDLAHSRGWEHGFLPAGSLEDVTDFQYWLSTNALTWRGVEYAARALETAGHPEAERVRREADAYRADLRRGFALAREHAPLVRLRDGRWVPHHPSRLYRRGRDIGWIRETLEGSIYLLLSGLLDASEEEAGWILDDFQDNRYPCAPFGYNIDDFERTWFARAGFSIQPNLLAGLLPYLERDEPEVYLWMFFNAWCSCYREEGNCMTEHPMPYLGYSNSAQFKTSDQANAMMWLRYTLVFADDDRIHFGKAKPIEWREAALTDVRTRYGKVSVRYHGDRAHVELNLHEQPKQILVRFRGGPLAGADVDGSPMPIHGEDVDITGRYGRLTIEVRRRDAVPNPA